MFDEILADCLEALVEGATIRDCLIRYPAEAARLEPLLRLAVALSREGETRLSAGVFEQGRRRLLTEARARHRSANQPTEIRHRQPRHTPPVRQTAFPPYRQNGLPQPQHQSRPRARIKSTQRHFRIPRLLRVALMLLIIVSATTFVRQAATSLPGTWLYPVKNGSERMVGVLMIAAGEEIRWQANQLERRLAELNELTDASPTLVQSATQALESDWQSLLAASAGLSAAERTQLIEAQIGRLQQFERSWANRQGLAAETAVVTVRRLIATGETVLATPLSIEETPTVAATATVAAVASTPTMTPTAPVTATPTALLQPSATAPGVPILEPSPTPTPSLTLAPATATLAPPSPTASPTPLPEIPVQIPLQESSQEESDRQERNDDRANDASAPTGTPTPLTPEALTTDTATVTPAVGTGPEEGLPTSTPLATEAVATPTPDEQTPTVTSGEGALPLPTKSAAPATATPEPVAPTARPTNQPTATKTPKATATQANTDPATPNAPAGTPSTPVERTPNATTQAPIATKEAATETPAAASPTPRATNAGGEATKTPSP